MKVKFLHFWLLILLFINGFASRIFAQTTFNYTGSMQNYTVPVGVTSINVDVQGAGGGIPFKTGALYTTSSKGGRVTTTLSVTPGEVLYVFVGGKGADGTSSAAGVGGWNGGGAGTAALSAYASGGGGASDIRRGGTALSNRIVVSGGGGGCNDSQVPNGAGGGLIGGSGNINGAAQATGGSQSVGGIGAQYTGYNKGSDGSLGIGGGGASNTVGGGGGGGNFGGGGGSFSSGGGGSSYTVANATNVVHTQGYNTGNGTVVITVNAVPLTPPGNALNFDGTNSNYVDVNTTLGNVGAGNFTLETWVRTTAPSNGVYTVLGKRKASGANGNFLRIYIKNGTATCEIDGSNQADYTNITSNTILNDGIWHHIAAVRNGTQLLLYIDGKSDATPVTLNGNPNINNSFMFSFGRILDDNGNPVEYFTGSIDETKIYNTNLSLANIQSDMLNTTISVPASLLAYYNFDKGTAGGNNTGINTLTDNSGNANTGTLSNFALTGATSNWIESYAMVVPVPTAATAITQTGFTANWTTPAVGTVDNNYRLDVSTSPTFASFVSGYNGLTVAGTSQSVTGLTVGTTYYYRVRADKTSVTAQGGYHFTTISATTLVLAPPGNALNFNGSNSNYVDVNTTLGNVGTGNFTLETWVRTTASSNGVYTVLGKRKASGANGNFLRIYIKNGTATCEIDGSNQADYTNITSNTILNDGIWHHIAAVRNGTQLFLYIDGKSDATPVTLNGNPNINNAFMFSFGRILDDNGNPVEYFTGSIDETKIYNTNLSLANIQSDMLNTTISKPANLWAYYNFDNGVAGGTNTGLTTLTDNSGNLHTGTLSNFTLTGATSNWIESYSMVVPVPTAATTIMQTGFTANWTAPAVGTVDNNYRLDVSTSPTFASFVTGYNGLTVAGTSQSVTGLTAGTTYYYRVRADKTSVTGQGGYHFTTINATTLTALPVQITEITAQLLNNKTAVVKWISATEINLSNYDIQRSNDGTNFSTVGTVAAKGSGAYSFNDDLGNAGVLPATIYYRLKAVDKDASKMYSKVVAVGINALKASITIYPNPVQAILYINISAIKDNAAQLRIVDMQGKIVATQNAKLVAGTTLLTIPTIWLAAGSYTLDIITPDGKQSQRFIKE